MRTHCRRRWFEKQDALKVRRRAGELPDFYNITLERPKEDPAGFDVIFVDAAPAGSFASRLSHSCTPNCQAHPPAPHSTPEPPNCLLVSLPLP